LEEKSQQRDDVINAWCQEMNQMMNCIDFATYTVIAGCHEPQYKVSTMLAFFKTQSELSRLIIPYYTENTLCQSLALEMTPKDMTFIAVVDGYDDSFNSNLPLLLQKKRNNCKNHHFQPYNKYLCKYNEKALLLNIHIIWEIKPPFNYSLFYRTLKS
jgi:hypothetical protein